MSLSTYRLEYGRHVARLRRRRAYAPTSNTASHDNNKENPSWVSFFSRDTYGAPLGGPLGRQGSAITLRRVPTPESHRSKLDLRSTSSNAINSSGDEGICYVNYQILTSTFSRSLQLRVRDSLL